VGKDESGGGGGGGGGVVGGGWAWVWGWNMSVCGVCLKGFFPNSFQPVCEVMGKKP